MPASVGRKGASLPVTDGQLTADQLSSCGTVGDDPSGGLLSTCGRGGGLPPPLSTPQHQ